VGESDAGGPQYEWPYERRPRRWQRFLLDQHADRAEWNVPGGRLGGLVRQLRRRAQIAHARSKVFLFFLFLTVGFGLIVYLGMPTLMTAIDGRREALADSIASADRLLAEQDTLRIKLRDDLIAALDLAGEQEVLPGLDGISNVQTFKMRDGTTLLYGGGNILRLDPATGTMTQVAAAEATGFAEFLGAAETDGESILLFGMAGSIVRFDPAAGVETPLDRPAGTERVWYLGAVALTDGSVLVYGNEGAVVHLGPGSRTLTRFDPPAGIGGVTFRRAIALADGRAILIGDGNTFVHFSPSAGRDRMTGTLIQLAAPAGLDQGILDGYLGLAGGGALAYGSSGKVVRFDAPTGAPSVLDPPATSGSVIYRGSLPLKSGEVLLYGDEGAVVLFDPLAGTLTRLENPTGTATVWYNGALELDTGALLAFGDEGTVVHVDLASLTLSRLTTPEGTERVVYVGAVSLPGGDVLVYGDEGTVTRIDTARQTMSRLDRPVGTERVRYSGAFVREDETALVYGNQGTAVRYDPTTGALKRLSVPEAWFGRTITQMFDLGSEGVLLVLHGDAPPTLFGRFSDRYARAAREITPLNDNSLEEFLTSVLPPGVRDGDAVVALRPTQAGIIAQTSVANETKRQAMEAEAGLWSGSLVVQDERLAFREFMQDCRGPQDPDKPMPAETANQITLACSAAWQADLAAEEGSPWQTLAETVPPGVLLLFLLGTLGGLYRYNLRLAGFHDSRADALELLSLARSDDEVRVALDSKDSDVLLRIANALAADKVAFGAGRDPTDQAVDLAKGILSQK
jgi:hypothetical protein